MVQKSSIPSGCSSAAVAREENRIGNLLRQTRHALGLDQRELSLRLEQYGVSIQPAGISKWESGANVPNAYQFLALCRCLGINDPLSCLDSEHPGFGQLNAQGRKKLDEYASLLVASGLFSEKPPMKLLEMKVFDLPASAGTGLFLDSEDYSMQSFPADEIPDGTDFGIRVSGRSMYPRYADGQIAWVQQCRQLRVGDIGIFVYDGDAYIKQYALLPAVDSFGEPVRQACLVSLNPDYPNRLIPPDAELFIVGRVLN